jgi:hypothetical protein
MPDEPGPHDTPHPPKSYLSEAFLTLALYYLALGIGGFIANFYFLRQMRLDREAGIPAKYGGCLVALLIVHAALLVGLAGYLATNFLIRPGG